MSRQLTRLLQVLAVATIVQACHCGPPDSCMVEPATDDVVSLSVTPPQMQLIGIGVSQLIQAAALGRRGQVIANARIDWVPRDPNVVVVSDSGGLLRAISTGPGTGTITGTVTGTPISQDVIVTVRADFHSIQAIPNIVLNPATNPSRGLRVVAVTDPGVRVSFDWAVADPRVVAVTPSVGDTVTLSAASPGSTTVTVRGQSVFAQTRTASFNVVVVANEARSVTGTHQ
jgi:hypothetical protein